MADKAVFWDMDGTLVLSERLKTEAHVRTVEHFGGRMDRDISEETMGTSSLNTFSLYKKYGGITASFEDYRKKYLAYCVQLRKCGIDTVPGARQVLGALQSRGVRQGLVTSSSEATMQDVLVNTGLELFFEVAVSADAVSNPKPNPAPYLLAQERMGITVYNALVVEDTDAGVQSGMRAGFRVVGVRHEDNHSQGLCGAHVILPGLANVDCAVSTLCDLLKID